MVILGGWVSYVVKEKIYDVETICEYEFIYMLGFRLQNPLELISL